jgi:hypothetical protein
MNRFTGSPTAPGRRRSCACERATSEPYTGKRKRKGKRKE